MSLHDEGHRVLLLDTNFQNISAAKMLGLEAQRANILSEFAEEELDVLEFFRRGVGGGSRFPEPHRGDVPKPVGHRPFGGLGQRGELCGECVMCQEK